MADHDRKPKTTAIERHPVQAKGHTRGWLRTSVTLRAYEVYSVLYGEQAAMVTDGCRGGFGTGEIIAFLYARSFPKSEWQQRFDEALRGMEAV